MKLKRHSVRAAIAIGALVFAGACANAQAAPRRSQPTVPSSRPVPTNAPTATTRMICAAEAQGELRDALGVTPTQPIHGTWFRDAYSCRYAYNDGSFALRVDQLNDATSAQRHYTALVGGSRHHTLSGLGQAAATTATGKVFVRKDNDVLIVDPGHLPARFGNPPDTRANVALTIAATIMGCWTG